MNHDDLSEGRLKVISWSTTSLWEANGASRSQSVTERLIYNQWFQGHFNKEQNTLILKKRSVLFSPAGRLDVFSHLLQLKDFIQVGSVDGVPALPRAVEVVEGNVRWHRLHRRSFFQWLRKPQSFWRPRPPQR